jgi:agmatinase
MSGTLKFAGSSNNYSSARFVIFGAPFDSTTSFRSGQRFAPNRIREASSTLERFVYDNKVNIKEKNVYDAGDLMATVVPKIMINNVSSMLNNIMGEFKIPIMLGGEHSVTIGIADVIKKMDASILFLDAHPDFRDELLDQRLSHGSVARRVVEKVGIEKVSALGIRAISLEENNDSLFKEYTFYTTDQVREKGVKNIVGSLLKKQGKSKIYLSLDLDVMDPAFAPGVATPEPFGLDPFQIREIIHLIGKRIIGADIVELDPPYDNGNTAVLAARFVQDIIASVAKI